MAQLYKAFLKHKNVHVLGEKIFLQTDARSLFEAFIKLNYECLEKYPDYEIYWIGYMVGHKNYDVHFKNQNHIEQLLKQRDVYTFGELESPNEFLIKTDFHVGQVVWTIINNLPRRVTIKRIDVHIDRNQSLSWWRQLFNRPKEDANQVLCNIYHTYLCAVDDVNGLLKLRYRQYYGGEYYIDDPYSKIFTEYEHVVEYLTKEFNKKLTLTNNV